MWAIPVKSQNHCETTVRFHLSAFQISSHSLSDYKVNLKIIIPGNPAPISFHGIRPPLAEPEAPTPRQTETRGAFPALRFVLVSEPLALPAKVFRQQEPYLLDELNLSEHIYSASALSLRHSLLPIFSFLAGLSAPC